MQENETKWASDNLNDRSVILYLMGDYQGALNLANQAYKINDKNLEAWLNQHLLQWKLGKLRDD